MPQKLEHRRGYLPRWPPPRLYLALRQREDRLSWASVLKAPLTPAAPWAGKQAPPTPNRTG